MNDFLLKENEKINPEFDVHNTGFREQKASKGNERDESDKLRDFLMKVSKTDATVLITGESGTGKSMLAKRIHDNSCVSNKKFVEVHCTTLPKNLLESELFGHEKGSFTGAVKTKVGKVEEADGGTLFLDEIGELSLEGQAKLLRLLQEKVINRLGSNQEIRVNTRIILATNKDLNRMVDEGSFRLDVYYRINIFEYKLPPLRERRNEIMPLVNKFMEECLKKVDKQKNFAINPELYSFFMEYHWPGNIREVKNIIERLCYLSEDGELQIEDLPAYINVKKNETGIKQEADLSFPLSHGTKYGSSLTLSQLEKNHIEYVMKSEKNLKKVADILGITTVTLWRKRKLYKFI